MNRDEREYEYMILSMLEEIDRRLEKEALRDYAIYEDEEEEQTTFDATSNRIIDYLLKQVRECLMDDYSEEVITYDIVKAINLLDVTAGRFYGIISSSFMQKMWREWGEKRIARLERWYERNMSQARILIEEAISVARQEDCGIDFSPLFDFLSVVEYVAKTALNLMKNGGGVNE